MRRPARRVITLTPHRSSLCDAEQRAQRSHIAPSLIVLFTARERLADDRRFSGGDQYSRPGRFGMFRLKWQKQKKQNRKSERDSRPRNPPMRTTTARRIFHGVAILPDRDLPCEAVTALANVRYLADEAPMLPVAGCSNRANCHCRYQHFDDRRTEARRESDVGIPVKEHPNDTRSGCGRRVTDG